MNGAAPTAAARPPASRWIARLRPVEDARLRLLCFPHVGAGAAAFRPWLDHLPPGVELCAVRPPGRENRLQEELITDGHALLDALEPHAAPLLDVPFLVVGHCSGSVPATEFVRRLLAAGGPRPAALVVSSAEGPRVRAVEDPPLHRLPRAELLARVVKYGGTAAAVLDDPDLMAVLERILRADYQLVETLAYTRGAPLPLPLTVIGGRRDEFVGAEAMAAWSTETDREFALHLLDAGHYILAEAGPLIGRIARQLLEPEADR
ncbi:alpha/beta fold hydrolase [Kitasatospora paracochleata]|uniref:Medium-chain acyl-[acyl-carrier-protein] hydrolase n=1 Tax=Kitasatospora paracochleata TaxID=58354 RepID=A0ABT1JA94_9ACTN|nr:thioesterase domain-containing protein [Kitasatospora paracochleata]MCP2314379.1 medium-chain acyl-[acyl-carrier-protein] hydrolase [Kitasatospora paracochleata]